MGKNSSQESISHSNYSWCSELCESGTLTLEVGGTCYGNALPIFLGGGSFSSHVIAVSTKGLLKLPRLLSSFFVTRHSTDASRIFAVFLCSFRVERSPKLHRAESEAVAQSVSRARKLFEFPASHCFKQIELFRLMREAAQADA